MNHHQQYFAKLAAAYIRGQFQSEATFKDKSLEELDEDQLEAVFEFGKAEGLKLYPFKRTQGLPRVQEVVGFLKGIQPASLLDIGTGRGVFLYPFLDNSPYTPVQCLDLKEHHIADLHYLRDGGIDLLDAIQADVTKLPFEDNQFDCVTALEVLEHIEDTEAAFAEIVRVAKKWVICSMPSQEDDNEEHIHLFDEERIRYYFAQQNVTNVKFSHVHEHIIAFAKL